MISVSSAFGASSRDGLGQKVSQRLRELRFVAPRGSTVLDAESQSGLYHGPVQERSFQPDPEGGGELRIGVGGASDAVQREQFRVAAQDVHGTGFMSGPCQFPCPRGQPAGGGLAFGADHAREQFKRIPAVQFGPAVQVPQGTDSAAAHRQPECEFGGLHQQRVASVTGHVECAPGGADPLVGEQVSGDGDGGRSRFIGRWYLVQVAVGEFRVGQGQQPVGHAGQPSRSLTCVVQVAAVVCGRGVDRPGSEGTCSGSLLRGEETQRGGVQPSAQITGEVLGLREPYRDSPLQGVSEGSRGLAPWSGPGR